SIVVNAPASEVYQRLLGFADIPRFITAIDSIQKLNDTHFSFTSVVDGKKIKSDVMIMMRVPDRRIAWQAASDQFRIGVVFVDPLLGGLTKVTVKIRSTIKPALLTQALCHYLRNFKQFVEEDISA